jgi:tetratricopeptide (TPR) repeat protein
VFALIAVVLSFTVAGRRNNKVQKMLELGNEYMSEMDYEGAIGIYRQVIELDSKCDEAYKAIADCYIQMEEYESALVILETALDNVDNTDYFADYIENLYLMTSNSGVVASDVKLDNKNVYLEGDVETYLDESSTLEVNIDNENMYHFDLETESDYEDEVGNSWNVGDIEYTDCILFKEIYENLQPKEYNEMIDFIYYGGLSTIELNYEDNAEWEEIATNLQNEYVDGYVYLASENEVTEGLGLYRYDTNKYYFYLGGYNKGVRSGQGYMFNVVSNMTEVITFSGKWENDAPNGSGEIRASNIQNIYTNQSGFVVDGIFKDGLANGNIEFSYIEKDGNVFKFFFKAHEGIPTEDKTKEYNSKIKKSSLDLSVWDSSEAYIYTYIFKNDGYPMFYKLEPGMTIGVFGFCNWY